MCGDEADLSKRLKFHGQKSDCNVTEVLMAETKCHQEEMDELSCL